MLADGAPAVRVDSGCAQRELVVVADGAVPPCESVGGGLADVNVLARVDVFVERDRFVDIRTSAVDGDWGRLSDGIRESVCRQPPTSLLAAGTVSRLPVIRRSATELSGVFRGSFRGCRSVYW